MAQAMEIEEAARDGSVDLSDSDSDRSIAPNSDDDGTTGDRPPFRFLNTHSAARMARYESRERLKHDANAWTEIALTARVFLGSAKTWMRMVHTAPHVTSAKIKQYDPDYIHAMKRLFDSMISTEADALRCVRGQRALASVQVDAYDTMNQYAAQRRALSRDLHQRFESPAERARIDTGGHVTRCAYEYGRAPDSEQLTHRAQTGATRAITECAAARAWCVEHNTLADAAASPDRSLESLHALAAHMNKKPFDGFRALHRVIVLESGFPVVCNDERDRAVSDWCIQWRIHRGWRPFFFDSPLRNQNSLTSTLRLVHARIDKVTGVLNEQRVWMGLNPVGPVRHVPFGSLHYAVRKITGDLPNAPQDAKDAINNAIKSFERVTQLRSVVEADSARRDDGVVRYNTRLIALTGSDLDAHAIERTKSDKSREAEMHALAALTDSIQANFNKVTAIINDFTHRLITLQDDTKMRRALKAKKLDNLRSEVGALTVDAVAQEPSAELHLYIGSMRRHQIVSAKSVLDALHVYWDRRKHEVDVLRLFRELQGMLKDPDAQRFMRPVPFQAMRDFANAALVCVEILARACKAFDTSIQSNSVDVETYMDSYRAVVRAHVAYVQDRTDDPRMLSDEYGKNECKLMQQLFTVHQMRNNVIFHAAAAQRKKSMGAGGAAAAAAAEGAAAGAGGAASAASAARAASM